jgi:hypothetical protein
MGQTANGTYIIRPTGSPTHFHVVCEMHDNQAWTVIQRRVNGSVDFYRNWTEYRDGFGDPAGEVWLGNERLYWLTNQATYKLRIDMWDWTTLANGNIGRHYRSESNYFRIENESNWYTLHVPEAYTDYSGYYGGSGLRLHKGPFVTFDVTPPSLRENCAEKFHCGWWFSTCVRNVNVNGRYYVGGYANVTTRKRERDDIFWQNIRQSLRQVVLKVGRVSPLTSNQPAFATSTVESVNHQRADVSPPTNSLPIEYSSVANDVRDHVEDAVTEETVVPLLSANSFGSGNDHNHRGADHDAKPKPIFGSPPEIEEQSMPDTTSPNNDSGES